MRNAFSLAEVLIAVVIISVVGLAMLQLNANQLFLFEQTKDRREANFLISIGAFSPPTDTNATTTQVTKTLDMGEYVKGFDIDDDEILRYFKNIKPLYTQEELSEIDLAEETRKDREAKQDEMVYKKTVDEQSENNYMVLISRISMQFDRIGSTLYHIALSE